MNDLFGNTLLMSQKSLDFLWAKQGATLANIANNDTPGYKAKTVTFEELFRKQLMAAQDVGSERVRDTLNRSRYSVSESDTESARMDGNNVNTDVESVELARTTLQYQYVINAFNSDVTRLRTALKA